jgi:hypothetical protein
MGALVAALVILGAGGYYFYVRASSGQDGRNHYQMKLRKPRPRSLRKTIVPPATSRHQTGRTRSAGASAKRSLAKVGSLPSRYTTRPAGRR